LLTPKFTTLAKTMNDKVVMKVMTLFFYYIWIYQYIVINCI